MKYRFLLLIFLIIPACVGGKAPDDRLIIAIESSPTTFDPRLASSAYSQKINRLIYNGLIKFNENFDFEPDLAKEYEQIDDVTFRFKIRDDVYFHNGDKLTLDDIIYTYQTIIDGTVASPDRTTFSFIEELQPLDDNVLVIKLKEPFAPFLTALRKGIVCKKAAVELGEDYGHSPVGTGAYEFVEFKEDAFVLLKRNDRYFGFKPRLPFLEFKILKDDNVRVLQLIKGNVDLIQNAVPPVLLSMLAKRSDLNVQAEPSVVFDYIGMNLEDKILSNLKVRQALVYAINREEIIKYKWEGYATVAHSLLFPEHWAYGSDITQYDYNPKLAKELLDRAGLKKEDGKDFRFALSYKTSTNKQRLDIANLIARQLEDVGIKVTVTPYEWGTFFRDIKTGNFQIYALSWIGVTEPDIYYSVYHSSELPPSGANRNRYVNKEIDRLTEEGRSTLNNAKRKEIYSKIQTIVSKELPYIPLWYEDVVVVQGNNIKGYKMRADSGFEGVVYVTKTGDRGQ